MANTYNIGNSTSQITLEADINTVGLAATRAFVLDVAGTDPGTAVAHSNDASGNLPPQPIGDFNLLKGKRLTVFTKISLTGSDATTRATEAQSVSGIYILSGGDDGTQTFTNTTSDYVDPNVFLNCLVDLQ
jgi:hypothetical protein